MTQTTYNINRTRAFAGLQADSRIPTEVLSASASEALNWGDAVYVSDWAAGEEKIVVSKIDATADITKLFGFVFFEHRQRNTSNQTISANQDVAILTKGCIWVNNTAGTITAGNKLIIDATSVLFKSDGGIAADAKYHGVEFLSNGSAAGDLVKIWVNLPNYRSAGNA